MLKTSNFMQLKTQAGNLLRCFGNSREVNSDSFTGASVVTCIPVSGLTRIQVSFDTVVDLKPTQIHSSLRNLHCLHPSCAKHSAEIQRDKS